MKSITIISLTLLLALARCLGQEHEVNPRDKSDNSRPLVTADKQAVMLAIVDEIYANQLQGDGFDVGEERTDSGYQLRAYFKPTLNSDGGGLVIYKLMPYGEVSRWFWIVDGTAVLYGKPENNFPPTEPSYLTVYMDDDELCQCKAQWSRENIPIELKPSEDRVAEAIRRNSKSIMY